MRLNVALASAAIGLGLALSGCADLKSAVANVVWSGDTVNVSKEAAKKIGQDAADLLDTHYQRNAAFQVVATEDNPVTEAIILKLREMGYAVDVVFQGQHRKIPVRSGEVLMSLEADNMNFKDIVEVEVHVDRVTATRIYTNVSGLATGPWTVTAGPLPKGVVTVGPLSAAD
jgi:hypothetical protein